MKEGEKEEEDKVDIEQKYETYKGKYIELTKLKEELIEKQKEKRGKR